VNQSLQYLAMALNLKSQWEGMLDSREITEPMRFSYYILYYYRLLRVDDLDGWSPDELSYLRQYSIEPLDLTGVDLR
jgi:hypothetical protein